MRTHTAPIGTECKHPLHGMLEESVMLQEATCQKISATNVKTRIHHKMLATVVILLTQGTASLHTQHGQQLYRSASPCRTCLAVCKGEAHPVQCAQLHGVCMTSTVRLHTAKILALSMVFNKSCRDMLNAPCATSSFFRPTWIGSLKGNSDSDYSRCNMLCALCLCPLLLL